MHGDSSPTSRRAATGALLMLGFAVTVVAYAPSFDAPFIFDDRPAIVDNQSIRTLWPLVDAMTAPADTPFAGRPVVNLSFAINRALGGADARAFRLVNLALHLCAGLLVFRLLATLLGRAPVPAWLRERARGVASVTAVLWLVHPLNTEAVIYLTQRTDLLAALCWLGALDVACAGFVSARPLRHVLIAFAIAAAGVGCKEWAATVGLSLLVIDRGYYSASWAEVFRKHGWQHAAMGLVLLLALGIVSMAPDSYRSFEHGVAVGPLDSLATQAWVVVRYLELAIWPSPLSISYHVPVAPHLLAHWPQALLLCALLGASVVALRRAPWLALPGTVFFGVLAPSSSFVPLVNEFAAERRMYVPLAALIAVLVAFALWCALRLARSVRSPRASTWLLRGALGLAAGCMLAASLATHARAREYRDEVSIWSAAVAADRDDPTALYELAHALMVAGQLDKARVYARRLSVSPLVAWREGPWSARGERLLAEMAATTGQPDEALAHYDRALRADEEFAEARLARGMLYLSLDKVESAVRDFERVAAAPGGSTRAAAYTDLGLARLRLGQPDAALAAFLEALELDPDNIGALSNMSSIFAGRGQYELARTALERALQLSPADPILLRNRAALQVRMAGSPASR